MAQPLLRGVYIWKAALLTRKAGSAVALERLTHSMPPLKYPPNHRPLSLFRQNSFDDPAILGIMNPAALFYFCTALLLYGALWIIGLAEDSRLQRDPCDTVFRVIQCVPTSEFAACVHSAASPSSS